MTILLQHCLNTAETAVLYSLVACGFYLVSISTRHFAFAAASSFIVAPYAAVFWGIGRGKFATSLLGLCLCGVFGVLYQRVSAQMSRKGAREGQLLIVSLATMAIAENLITMFFGSSSQALSPVFHFPPVTLPFIHITGQELAVLVVGWGAVTLVLFQWGNAVVGKTLQALVESRLNLSLRGMPIQRIESMAASIGFILIGISGTLWAIDGRIKPAMCTDVGVIGAVTFIVGALLRSGPAGLILASAALALGRLFFSLTLDGDWSMTAMLVVLGLALLLKRSELLRVESAL